MPIPTTSIYPRSVLIVVFAGEDVYYEGLLNALVKPLTVALIENFTRR